MPTQEDINAANVELQIANDNYAQLADRYNKYQQLFQTYAKSSPEIQDRAADAMWRALEDFYQIEEKMRAAEDRINLAQGVVNNYNNIIASQPVQQTVARSNYNSGRYISPTPTVVEQPVIEQPTVEVTTSWYKATPYSGSTHNINLRRWAEQPFTLPYQNNTLAWIVGNAGAQIMHDQREAWQQWNNIVWPRIKSGLNSAGNAWKKTFVDAPSKAADAITNFVLWTPQRKL